MPRSLLTATLCISALIAGPSLAQEVATLEKYRAQGEAEFAARIASRERPDRARNVVIFIGDGMSVEDCNPSDMEKIHALFSGGANLPARVRAFVDFLVDNLR